MAETETPKCSSCGGDLKGEEIESPHLMEINHLNISEIKQLSESDARTYCRFSYVDFRFVDRCISDMKTIKEEGQ